MTHRQFPDKYRSSAAQQRVLQMFVIATLVSIGLSLVLHIAQAHGGRAWVTDAAEGPGAVVAITLPALPPSRSAAPGPEAEPRA